MTIVPLLALDTMLPDPTPAAERGRILLQLVAYHHGPTVDPFRLSLEHKRRLVIEYHLLRAVSYQQVLPLVGNGAVLRARDYILRAQRWN